MNKVKVLQQAIGLAIKNGWKPVTPDDATMMLGPLDSAARVVDYWDLDWRSDECVHVIFNHDFAKALWGDSPMPLALHGKTVAHIAAYKLALIEMVLVEDPVAYLAENMPDVT